MPAPNYILRTPKQLLATVTVENVRTDTAIQLAIDFCYSDRNTSTTVLYPRKNHSPSRIKKTGILFSGLQQCIRSHLLSFNVQLLPGENCKHVPKHTRRKMVLTIAEEAALEE